MTRAIVFLALLALMVPAHAADNLGGCGGDCEARLMPTGGQAGDCIVKGASAPAWGSCGGQASEAFPVGAIFISSVSTNPNTLLGYGQWSAFAAGRVLVGFDAAQTEFDADGETGGAKTTTLTTTELPAHSHTQDAHGHTQNAHTHVITSQTATTGSATSYEHGTLDTSSAETEATEVTGSTTATNQTTVATNQSTGSGAAFSRLPPYVTVRLWVRTE